MTIRESLGTKTLFRLFAKRLIKYFTMFILCISLAIPLLVSKYSIIREERLQDAQRQLQNGLNVLEMQIQKASELVSVILEDHDLMQLMLVEGTPPPEQYPVIRTMQKRLTNLSMMQEGFESSYLLFKYNPIMISEKYSSDYRVAFHQIYPNAQITAEQWHQAHFKELFFAGQYEGMEALAGENPDTFVYLFNVSQYLGVYSVCVMGCVFSKYALIKTMLPSERIEDSTLILSSDTQDILRYNAERDGEKGYIVVQAHSESLGLHAVERIPTSILSKTVFTMLMWTIIWFIAGTFLVFVCALLFTLLETRNMGSIVSVAYHSDLPPKAETNEYLYIRSTIQHINADNKGKKEYKC